MTRPFRFGVVAPVLTDMAAWRDQARRIADQGYSTLLMPDVPLWQPAPGPALATAAAVADLRVGTWVYASPFRPPWATAWEAHSLSLLTDGRFELGIGTGRPGIEGELREKGMPVQSPGRRLAGVRETITTLREHDGPDRRTPVVLAVRGPRARAMAVELADTITFSTTAADSREDVAALAAEVGAGRDLELALHVPVVGDAVAPFMASAADTDPQALREADSLLVLPADRAAAVDELLRRRAELGASYIVIGADVAGVLAPVVAELAGR